MLKIIIIKMPIIMIDDYNKDNNNTIVEFNKAVVAVDVHVEVLEHDELIAVLHH